MFYNKLFFLLCTVLFCAGDQFEDECGLEAIESTPLVRGRLGGVKAKQFPWQVAIFHRNKDNQFKQVCGGSMLRNNLVISAAHCFSDRAHSHQIHVADYRIVAGVLSSFWNSTERGRQQSEVREVGLGEDYGASYRNFQDDIAIIHLMKRFTFSDTVRAICLDLTDMDLHSNQTSPGSVGKVAGWGLTESGDLSDSLNFLRVPVVASGDCFDKLPLGFKEFFTADKICAGFTNGSAVCQGDSGGGLVFPVQTTSVGPQRWYLRGVLSNAPTAQNLNEPCVANVALYTNIYIHKMWLTTQMDDNLPRESCRVKGFAGVCRDYSECLAAKQEAFLGILPQPCSPSSSKICCVVTCPPLPPSTVSQQKTGSKANDYCVDLAESLYPCQYNGSSWSRGDLCGPEPEKHNPLYRVAPITSPSDIQLYGFAPEGVIPDMTIYSIQVFLVSERWLLTEATVGDYLFGLSARNITPSPDVEFSISRAVRHPQYISGNYANNIILVEMDRPISFSRSYRPVCLHTPQESVGLEGLALTRWDRRANRYPATVLSQEECRREFPPGSTLIESHLCVTSNTSSRRSCDITPYLTASNAHRVACTQLLMGLSRDNHYGGSGCIGVYFRLSPYVPWVESVVWP